MFRFKGEDIAESTKEKRSWLVPAAAGGLLAIVLGIFLETFAEGKVSDIDASLRSHESDKITAAEGTADAAIKKSAELDNQTQGLKTDAANAKRDMVAAQLELARLTGPIQEVPVINGVAEPSPLKGTKLRILLHRDILIKFPTLPKGTALSWKLILVEDSVGQHQFKTFPKQFLPGPSPGESYLLYLEPGTSISMDLISDETGTVDQSFGGATIMYPAAKTVILK